MITPDLARELFERSRRRSLWTSPQTLVLLVIGAMMGGLLANPSLLSEDPYLQVFVPQALLVSLFLWVWQRAVRQRRTAAGVVALWEAIQLKDWDAAEQQVVAILRRPVQPPHIRARSLLALAAVAENDKQFVAAQDVLESLLQERGAERGEQLVARVALAGTLLRTGQLTDAVEMIDKLLRLPLPPSLRAQVEMIYLYRCVLMGQVDDAIDRADERCALFRRYLSTRAGFGYGLLAVAFDRAGQPERAAALWKDATMLIPAGELVDRFAEIAPVAAKYPASEHPV